MHQGHADYTSMPIAVTVTEEIHCDELGEAECEESIYCEWHSDEGECENEDGGHAHEDCDGLDGDINSDDELNILDVVAVVAVILGNDFWSTECQGVYADVNDDGILDVLDVVRMVNTILNDRVGDFASIVELKKFNSGLKFEADGYVGAIQVTINHGTTFNFKLTERALVSDYRTENNTTTIILVNPEEGDIFTSQDYFTIETVVAASIDSYIDTQVSVPSQFEVSNAYPNPFNPSTNLFVELSSDSNVSIAVYNLMGQLVQVLSEGQMSAGLHSFTWDAKAVPSGVYFINTEVGSNLNSQKVMLIK